MSKPQDKKRQQVKLARLEIVATLYKRGYSIRKIQSEVMKRLDLKTYSIATCHSDIQSLLEEWRENRIEDMDAALQQTARKQKGSPTRDNQTGQTSIRTYQTERTETEVIRLGDPSYIAEIRMQLAERRKLLGLYAPEKKDIQGGMSFASFLIESGMLDEAEQEGGK